MSAEDRTPPQIVAASEDPGSALAAFIAQELEQWGFRVLEGDGPTQLVVSAPGSTFEIEVWNRK